jgi:DNA-binding MarR family transcriptional regulator
MPLAAATAPVRSTSLATQAEQLLDALSSIRRSGRLMAGRPVELSTLTGSQLELIRLVLRRPGISVALAAEELHLAPNTVSTLVRQLTVQHLLARRVDPDDRRVARLELTPAMARKVGDFQDRRVAMLASALQRLPAGEQQRLADVLSALDLVAGELRDDETRHG